MRDVIVTLLVLATLPYILRYPWYGVLAWSWLSYMNPHRMAWGFAYSMPFAQIVAITLLISLLINKEDKSLPKNNIVVVWAAFLVWMSITTAMAFYPEVAIEQLIKVLKIELITFVTLLLMKDFQRVNQLIWVIVFSMGFFSVKGGVFTVLTGGGATVGGPDGGAIEENNTFAVAILMILPMMLYLYKFPPREWVEKYMPFFIFTSLISVVGTQSRGALVSIAAVSGYFWLKTKSKLATGVMILFLGGIGFVFMPASWHARMSSIINYEQDASAMGRINAWVYSIGAANDRITGGGFDSWSDVTYAKYSPRAAGVLVAHSIYFSVLADHGWPGLFLFLSILIMMWRQFSRVILVTQGKPDYAAHNYLARMLKISMVAYMSGGAFLSLAYFDLAWHLMTLAIAMTHLTQELSQNEDGGTRVEGRSVRAGSHRRPRRTPGKTRALRQ